MTTPRGTRFLNVWESSRRRGKGGILTINIQSRLISRNVTVNGHRTSLRLEHDVWDALEEVCAREGMNMHEVCTMIDARRTGSSRTAAVRAFVLGYFRAAASDTGHVRAGHGNVAARGEPKRKRGGLDLGASN